MHKTLAILQVLCLSLIALFVAHTWFTPVIVIPTAFNIILELHGIILKLSDFAFLGLIVVTGLRVVSDADYRRQLLTSINRLLQWRSNQAWVTLTGFMFLSALWSSAIALAIYQAFYTLLMLVMVVVMVSAQPQHRRWWIATFIIGASLQGIIAIAQIIRGGSIGLGWLGETTIPYGRAFGLTYNPNTLAGYLLIGATLTFASAQMITHRTRIYALIIVAGMCIVAGLLATRSRTAIIALVLALGCWFFRWLWINTSHRIAIIMTCAIMVVGIFIGFVAIGRGFNTHEISERLTFAYAGSIAAYRQSPLVGVGAGQVMLHIDRLINADTLPYYDLQADGLLQPGHNAFLNVFAELGPIGLLLFCAGLANPLINLRDLKSSRWGMSVCLLAVTCIMLFEFQFWLDPHWRMILFWLLGLYWMCDMEPQAVDPHI